MMNVTRAKFRTEHFTDVGAEDFRVGGPGDGQAGGAAIQLDGADHGGALPASAGSGGMQPLAPRGASAEAGQVGFGPAFVKEDEACRVETGLPASPAPPGFEDVGTVLFAGAECLFLYVRPMSLST